MQSSACGKMSYVQSDWGDFDFVRLEDDVELPKKKRIRYGFYSFKSLEKNIPAKLESDRLFSIMDDKFRLYRSEGWGTGRKVSVIQVIDENSRSANWVPYPRVKKIWRKNKNITDPLDAEGFDKRINISEGLRRIRRQIISDPFLNLAVSHRNLSQIDMLGFEADIKENGEDVLVDESVIDRYRNNDVVSKLESLGLHPHFSLSGNRSIYIWFFFSANIPRKMLSGSVEVLSHVLQGVKIDNISTEACVRLPTSYYYQTGRLARFYGIQSREDNFKYIESIQRDTFDEDSYYDTIEEFRVWLEATGQIKSASVVDIAPDSPSPTPVNIGFHEEFDRSQYATSYAGNHPHRDYFEGILSCGFNCDSHEAFHRGFFIWACHKFGDKDKAYQAILRVIPLNPHDYAVQDRQRRLDWLYRRVKYDPDRVSDKADFEAFTFTEEDLRFLAEMKKRLTVAFRASRAESFYRIAEWCYYLGRINNGRCGLGGEVIAKRFNIAVKNAYNALGLFWKRSNRLGDKDYGTEFNFLRIDQFHVSPMGAEKGKVREFVLDTNKFWGNNCQKQDDLSNEDRGGTVCSEEEVA